MSGRNITLRFAVAPRLIRRRCMLIERQKNDGKISLDYCSIFNKLESTSSAFGAADAPPAFPPFLLFCADVVGYEGAAPAIPFFCFFFGSTFSGLTWMMLTSNSPHSAAVNLFVTCTANSVFSNKFALAWIIFSETRPNFEVQFIHSITCMV